MTTIVADARAGIMASDSLWTDDTVIGSVRKVWRVRGDLVGFAGDVGTITQSLAWFRSGFDGDPPEGNATALILRKTGIYTWTAEDGEVKEDASFFAIGSGGQAARAVLATMERLRVPLDCRLAVRLASTIAAGNGGRVRVYKLGN